MSCSCPVYSSGSATGRGTASSPAACPVPEGWTVSCTCTAVWITCVSSPASAVLSARIVMDGTVSAHTAASVSAAFSILPFTFFVILNPFCENKFPATKHPYYTLTFRKRQSLPAIIDRMRLQAAGSLLCSCGCRLKTRLFQGCTGHGESCSRL